MSKQLRDPGEGGRGRRREDSGRSTARALWRVALIGAAALSAAPAARGAPSPPARASYRARNAGHPIRELIEADWIERDARWSASRAKTRAATVSGPAAQTAVSTAEDASGGCDGVKNGRWGFHTASGETDPWWQVDLGADHRLDRVVVYNRTDRGTAPRTRNLRVLAASAATPDRWREVYRHDGTVFGGVADGSPLAVAFGSEPVTARWVRLAVPGRCSFALDEVEVYGAEHPEVNIALGRPADQKSVGPYSWPGTLPGPGITPPAAARAARGGGFALLHTREILERARALAARLRREAAPSHLADRLARALGEVGAVEARLEAAEGRESIPLADRRELYLDARWAARAVAFANPRLSFDRLLFIKKHDARGVYHMCDQYYGFNAVAGGGLFVLESPFSTSPRERDLLGGAVVESGRLRGRRLAPGAFLSPELSFDARSILFAYTEAKGRDLEWTETSCWHIFRVDAGGEHLVQLTDGPTDDFDPCFLPGGRVVFVSERRGGYLRCGRHCPTYAMFSMAADGSDIRHLSYHETHEWHPSVDRDGRIVYTRWDYVDRDTNVAHHIWTCYPDGRDPRTFHGNYPERRESRPWMEMSIRAVPDSTLYVATAAAHHGHAFGSLVLIDPRRRDDGSMGQLERLTPDAPFPEAEERPIRPAMRYGTPWPLSPEDYLCVWDPNARDHGIYWLDRAGNRELLWRDPAIACLSPIPLRPRPRPPVIPDRVDPPPLAEQAQPATGTISIVDLYDSDFAWPEGTRIAALRVIQVLPKTTPPPNVPRIGVADQTNARAVLGTVPVEEDGSAHFEAPAGKQIYFQALDERGLAVQSMRSGTYLHPGEQLTCQGCHEPRQRAPARRDEVPLAMRRAPSRIRPDVDGSNPFNYVRLVQPVLDRRCVGCHEREGALDLGGEITGPHGWTRSYGSLAGNYGFYFNVRNGSIRDGVHGGSRTPAGSFGARAAPLLECLDERHHGVRLEEEEFHRVALWLDCNSEFYGSYEETEAQARGEVVRPTLD